MTHDAKLHAARREQIAARMRQEGGGVMLLPAADEKPRNADSEYVFRQDSDYAYVTGFDEPSGCALLFADGRYVMFVRPRDPEREIWTGRRAGIEGARAEYGASEAYPASDVDQRLPSLLDGAGTLWFRLGADWTWDARVARALRDLRARARAGALAPHRVLDTALVLHEMRLFKADAEVRRLRKAAEITAEAHLSAMRDGQPGRREYQVQAEIEYAFRRRGATGPAYPSIVASGPNATVLHHTSNDRVLGHDELLLVDAGAERAGYCADVTRTYPTGRRYGPAQRDLYGVVLAAQLAAIAAARAGTTLEAVHKTALRVLVEGLLALGLLRGSVDEAIEQGLYQRFYMHRTSHWLGRDVHDVGQYARDGSPRLLEPGMVFTVEPGLYIPAAAEDVPAAFRGVGIRIEDDVVVTEAGCEVLSAAAPKHVEEVEALRAEGA
jgi:Xaa-Pro aminopeptidase